ncbi:MAG: hypothetical protein AAGD18_21985 [Actinomycetota bacterium]
MTGLRLRAVAGVMLLLVVSAALVGLSVVDRSRDCAVERINPVRTFDDLPNVDLAVTGLGAVWAVTSDLPDTFSPGDARASLIRVDPASGRTEHVLTDLTAPPAPLVLAGRVWVGLDDRVIALDADGEQVDSFGWDRRGTVFAGPEHLWLTDFEGGAVVVVDPSTAEVVRTIATGAFPVAPIVAFGRAWVPSAIEGTVTVIDTDMTSGATSVTLELTDRPLTDVVAVPNGSRGAEVWAIDLDGVIFAIDATATSNDDIRRVEVDRAINQVVPSGDRAVLLPTWGRSVLIVDVASAGVLAELDIGSIPVRAIAAGGRVWVTTDGAAETLSLIDPMRLEVLDQRSIGVNSSNTTGPTQPVATDDEVWVPNRGDDTLYAIPMCG